MVTSSDVRSGIAYRAACATHELRKAERLETRPAFDSTDAFFKAREADDARQEADRLLAVLPESLRAVVVLREIEGMSHAEIARALGISEATSRVRLLRGLERLRRTLKREE